MLTVNMILLMIFAIRLVSLAISIKNEKRLIAQDATQIGKKNSKFLSFAHVLFYVCAFIEAYINQTPFDETAKIGLGLIIFSLIALFYVIYALRAVWTVKVYILPQHPINRSWLFRIIRHPNYFLNIIPELCGVALLCHSYWTALIGLPIYGIILAIRIYQETQAMKPLLAKH